MSVVRRQVLVRIALAWLTVVGPLAAGAAGALAADPGASGERVVSGATAPTGVEEAVDADGAPTAPAATTAGSSTAAPGPARPRAARGITTSTVRDRSAAARDGVVSASADRIELTQTLALTPDRPGEVRVTLSYAIPDQVTDLSTELPGDATVVERDGFDAASEQRYEWSGATDSPSLTYRLPANVTGGETGPVGTSGDYLFVDAGPWAIVRIPSTPTSWRYRGTRPEFVHERTTAGPGALGEAMAFLGEHAVHTRAAHGQRFRLVVPAAASMGPSPETVLDELAAAGDAVRVGGRDEHVFFVVAPTDGVEWGVRGLQAGPADAWVRDVEGFDGVANVWVHEYVHTRQGWTGTEGTRWLTEASASYYAALQALERGHVGYDAFRNRMAAGTRTPQSEARLARPGTWRNDADYLKGALVAGALDRRIRLATDRRRSLQHVLRAMNEHGEPVTADAFRSMVADAGNASVGRAADRYTTTEAAPSTWDRDAHETAFGETPAYIEVSLADQHAVAGPYRNRSLQGRSVTLVPGETVTVAALVANSGGAADEHETAVRVDGEHVATRTGRVGPDESVHLNYSHAFEETGSHTVSFGDATLYVAVRRPAEAAVSDLSVGRTSVEPGESLAVTATVRNDADVPGRRTVTVRVDGRPVAERTVRLDAGERREVTVTTTFDEPGRYRVRAGSDETATVVVEAPATTTATPGPLAVTSDGFGLADALLGVALLLSSVRAGRAAEFG